MKALFIGDDVEVADFITISIRLRWPDFTPLTAATHSLGLEIVEKQSPDVILALDSYAGHNMTQAVQELRSLSGAPLLIMGKQPAQVQVISALEAGADDYIRLPCGLTELVARVLAVHRRAGMHRFDEDKGPLVRGDLFMNPATYEAFLDGQPLNLTATEFRLLHILAVNSGRVLTHQYLERTLWGEDCNGGGLVKKYVQRLRSKLADDAVSPSYIASVHKVGYRFVGSNKPIQRPATSDREATTEQSVYQSERPISAGWTPGTPG